VEGDPFQEDVGREEHPADPLHLAEAVEGQNQEGEGRVDVLRKGLL
jgi:hypothetical protein